MVLGWLTKLVLLLAILGALSFDALALAGARFSAQDQAARAGRAAAAELQQTNDVQLAYEAALEQVAASGATIDPAAFVAADRAVTLTLRRDARSLVLHRLPPVRDWTRISATVTTRSAIT